MTTARKRDIDTDVQRIIDDVTAHRDELTTAQIRTSLSAGLGSVGVWLEQETLQSWAKAIRDGEKIRADIDYR